MLVKLFLYMFLFHVGTLFAEINAKWTINHWGANSPSTDYSVNNQSCKSKSYQPSSFLINSRGSGDAELVFSSKLTSNRAYNFSVGLSSNKKTLVSIFFRRDDFPYETLAIRQLEVYDRKLVTLKGIYTANTKGSVRIRLADIGTTVCIDSPSLSEINTNNVGLNSAQFNASIASTSNAGTPVAHKSHIKSHQIRNDFFGIHINKLGLHNEWPSFNPGTIRLWDTGTTWSAMQPTPEEIAWNDNSFAKRLDYYINYGKSNNPNVQFIYTLAMTPSWAALEHKANCGNSSYGRSSCMLPNNLEDWRNYVKQLGRRYKGVVKVWELWNEADQTSFWAGDPESLAKMAKIAHTELKKIDVQNKVIGPNVTILGFNYLNQFLKAGGGDYVDAFSIHSYIGRSPELALHTIRNLQQLLNYNGYGNKEIWNTETNVSCVSTFEDCEAIKANYPNVLSAENALAQGMLGNAALGVVNMTYYTWEGASLDGGGLGLVQSDFKTNTKAGIIYSNIKSWINGAELTYLKSENNGLNVVKINRRGQNAFVVWSFKDQIKLNLSMFPQTERLMQSSGLEQDITESTVSVGKEPVLLFPKSFHLAS